VTPDQQFWWNWWVNCGIALATLLAVVVALFGQKWQAWLLPPRLTLTLGRKEGEKTQLRNQNDGTLVDDVRYYYLKVSNGRRWSPAEGVQVYLSRIEEPGQSGDVQVVWFGNVPIRWRDQEYVPLMRTIGSAAECDLCRVQKKGGFSLMPLILPNNLNAHWNGQFRLVASLQARSNQVDSEVVRIEISWNGSWEDGDVEMRRHLVINELPPEKRN
jgi:hypothetical protein